MSTKPAPHDANDALKNRLSRSREITITVTGRKSGRTISIPVWFVLEGDKLYLLPVNGSDTQWYKNVLENSSIQIEAGGSVKRTGKETNCIAQVTFSIDIQILWVIDISFSDTWQESRQIS